MCHMYVSHHRFGFHLVKLMNKHEKTNMIDNVCDWMLIFMLLTTQTHYAVRLGESVQCSCNFLITNI
jgi:hypothetical protein